MDLEIVILSEVSQRQISYDIIYMWNLKKGYQWTYLQNQNSIQFRSVQFSPVAQLCPTTGKTIALTRCRK